jgi:hypothetical protein
MLPVVDPDGKSTFAQINLFSILLIPISLIPSIIGLSGYLYFFGAFILGVALLIAGFNFSSSRSFLDARNLLKATVQCTSAKSKCIQNESIESYRPLLSPLPMCKPTSYIKIVDPTNKITACYYSNDDTFNNDVYDLKEFSWQNFKDSEG